jgi:hypothetical protein
VGDSVGDIVGVKVGDIVGPNVGVKVGDIVGMKDGVIVYSRRNGKFIRSAVTFFHSIVKCSYRTQCRPQCRPKCWYQ